jgi:hypothetical protein
MNAMKNYELQDLKNVVSDLIKENGATTTLEVKNALRAKGFKADQNQVSYDMSENRKDMNLQYRTLNNYRIYAPVGTLPSAALAAAPVIAYTRRDGTILETITENEASSEDWVVSDINNNQELFFSGDHTRDAVRSAYATIFKVPIQEVRSRMVGVLKNN